MNRLHDLDISSANAIRKDFQKRLTALANDLKVATAIEPEFDMEWEGELGSQVRDGRLHCHVRYGDRHFELVAYDAEFQLREPLEDIWTELDRSIRDLIVRPQGQ